MEQTFHADQVVTDFVASKHWQLFHDRVQSLVANHEPDGFENQILYLTLFLLRKLVTLRTHRWEPEGNNSELETEVQAALEKVLDHETMSFLNETFAPQTGSMLLIFPVLQALITRATDPSDFLEVVLQSFPFFLNPNKGASPCPKNVM